AREGLPAHARREPEDHGVVAAAGERRDAHREGRRPRDHRSSSATRVPSTRLANTRWAICSPLFAAKSIPSNRRAASRTTGGGTLLRGGRWGEGGGGVVATPPAGVANRP